MARSSLQAIAPKRWRLPSLEQAAAFVLMVQDVADTFSTAMRLLAELRILDGRIVEGVSLAAGVSTRVLHGLGREPRGFIVVRVRAAADTSLREDSAVSADATKITLVAAADGLFDILVF